MSTVVGAGTDVVDGVGTVVGGVEDEDAALAWGFAPSLEQLASTTSTTTVSATLRAIRGTLAAGR